MLRKLSTAPKSTEARRVALDSRWTGDEEFAKETRFFGADHRGTITRYGLHSREQHTPSLCYAPVMHFNAIVDD